MILFLCFLLSFSSFEKIYQTLKLTTIPNTSKFVKNTPPGVLFSNLLVFENVFKHGLECHKSSNNSVLLLLVRKGTTGFLRFIEVTVKCNQGG